MLQFVFHNKTKAKISKSFLEKVAKQVIDILKVKKNCEVGLFLVGEAKMKELNKQYRKQNCVTDVLSFSQLESKVPFIFPKIPTLSLGDVIVCYPQAKRQAKQYKHKVLTEVTILFIHGLLHLFGIDHDLGRDQAKKMMKIEKKVVKRLKF
jgi:probable rRNA maturation factor